MNIYYLTVSVGQEFGRGLAEGVWLRDSHEVAFKTEMHSRRPWQQASEGRLGQEEGSPAWFLIVTSFYSCWLLFGRLSFSTNGPLHRIV